MRPGKRGVARAGDVRIDHLEDAEILRRGIAGARKVVMLGVGHAINVEDPAGFLREALAFLRGLP